MVVEVDGGIHEKQVEYDAARSAMLISKGFQIIRFTNDEMENPISVREKIISFLESLSQDSMRKEESFLSFRK